MLGDGLTHIRPVSSNHIDRFQPSILTTVRSQGVSKPALKNIASSPIVMPCATGSAVNAVKPKCCLSASGPSTSRPVTGFGRSSTTNLILCLRRLLHADAHGGFVGVEACADVLDVVDERVDAFEHLGVRPGGFAVEAEHGQAGLFFDGVADLFVELAEQAVLGGEDLHQLAVLGVGEQIERAAAIDGEAGVVGDQGDLAIVELLEVVTLEHVDSAEHL